MSTTLTEIIIGAAKMVAEEHAINYSYQLMYEEWREDNDLQSELSVELSEEIHEQIGMEFNDDSDLTILITEIAFEAISDSFSE